MSPHFNNAQHGTGAVKPHSAEPLNDKKAMKPMQINFDVISCVVLPIVGYFCMIEMRKRAKKAIESKVFAYGLYRFKPVYGENALAMARGYARGGVILFIFSIVLPVAMACIKHFL